MTAFDIADYRKLMSSPGIDGGDLAAALTEALGEIERLRAELSIAQIRDKAHGKASVELEQQRDEAVALLRDLEWSYDGACPLCSGDPVVWIKGKHTDDCELLALLAQIGGE